MVDLVTDNLEGVATICRRFSVRRLDLFGSASGQRRREFDPGRSDLDFVVEFDEPLEMGPADQFFGLLEALEELLGCKIDLVDGVAIRNPYFRRSVEETREPIYVARSQKVAG